MEDHNASTTLRAEDQLDIEAAIEAKMRERNPLLTKTKAELRYIQTTARMVSHFFHGFLLLLINLFSIFSIAREACFGEGLKDA